MKLTGQANWPAPFLFFEKFFAAGEALGDLEGLALGAHGGGVGG